MFSVSLSSLSFSYHVWWSPGLNSSVARLRPQCCKSSACWRMGSSVGHLVRVRPLLCSRMHRFQGWLEMQNQFTRLKELFGSVKYPRYSAFNSMTSLVLAACGVARELLCLTGNGDNNLNSIPSNVRSCVTFSGVGAFCLASTSYWPFVRGVTWHPKKWTCWMYCCYWGKILTSPSFTIQRI